MSTRDSAHPELVEGPDFLKSGDPALTFPHGKTYGVNHPHCRLGGVPNLPGPITPEELARDWLGHVAAGRIGPPPSPG